MQVALPPTSYNAALPQGLASEAFLTELMNPYTIPNITAINHNGIRGQYLPLSIEAQMLENLKKRKFGEPFESVNTPAPPSYAPLNNNEASMSAEVLFYYRQLQRNMNQAQHLQQQTGGNEYKNNDISPEDQKSSREKKVTSSSHYRARNAFFMFRGYVSRIQSTTLPKFKSDNSTVALSLARPLSSNTSSLSPATTLPTPPDKVRSLAQTKVSVRCGIIWKSPCLESCKRRECANCRMRRVFRRASNYMKLRHAELECQIEDDPLPKKQKSETIDTKIESTDHVTTHDGDDGDDDGARKLAYMPLEKSFDWDEFERYYYESDLFAWHREEYLGSNGVLDLEELKRVWIENEKWNEQSFLKGARKRMAEVGSPNATNNGGMKTRTKS
ncbi:hypothetical protein BGZ54_006135 [Gamsiella multidivaricata]|nr:hypothetical protein BGZ54_006135 [Gamsiella multidivaricata]